MSHIHPDHQKCQPVEAKLNFVPYWHQLQKYDGNSSTLVWEAKETPLEYLTSMYHNYCTEAEVAFTYTYTLDGVYSLQDWREYAILYGK